MSAPLASGPIQTGPARSETQRSGVVLTDIDIPFTRLVVFFVKVALAIIPATIIVWLLMSLVMMAFGAFFGFGGRGWMMHT